MSQTARRTAYYGVVTALGLVLSYVETLIPISFGVPGAKPGLANLVILLCLRSPYDDYKKNITGAFLVGTLRIVLSGFLFGNLFAIAYSFAGFVTALAAEALMERANLRVHDASCAGGTLRGECLHLREQQAATRCKALTRRNPPAQEESVKAPPAQIESLKVPPAQETCVKTQGAAASDGFGLTAISAVGGVMHNMGQLLVAVALCGTPVLAYLPWLIIFGVAAGLVTGIPGALLIKRVKQKL